MRDAVAALDADVPVEIAFGMADRATLKEAVSALEEQGVRRIAVVRLFVSGESFIAQTEYLLGLDATVPAFLYDSAHGDGEGHGHAPVADPSAVDPVEHRSEIAIVAEGLGDAELAGGILAQRALGLSNEPTRETVLVIAHGMGDEAANARLIDALEARAGAIRAEAPFRRVAVATLREDWDEARAAAEEKIRDIVRRGAEDGEVIAIPFRVVGFGPYAEVLEGLDYTADGVGLLPHAEINDWIVRSARKLACERGWILSDC